MKVAWVSLYDAADPGAYQGRGYYAPLSLKRQDIAVEYFGPLGVSIISKVRRKINRALHSALHDRRIAGRGAGKWYSCGNAPFLFKGYARQLAGKLAGRRDIDIVCSGVSPVSQPISYLECRQPIVMWVDTTYASAIDFYPQYHTSVICPQSLKDIVANEKAAMSRCRLAIYASDWGAKSAITSYDIDPAKVRVVPFGANLECNRSLEDVREMVDARPRNRCNLLFIGVDWLRKGGDIVARVAEELNRLKVPAELSIVGCEPLLDAPLPDYVKSYGYVSSATEEGSALLSGLFSSAHFFFMPSRAESFGHVYCEASSFGVPSLAADVGGVGTAVRNNVNGMTFSPDAGADEYCRYIADVFLDYPRYKDLALSSFNEYESRLNWAVAGRSVRKLLMEI